MTESKTKKCEVCGARKPIADFSKSYKKRCKACVAAEERMRRESAREEENRVRPRLKEGVHRVGSLPVVFKKARIRANGEVVEVTPTDEPMQLTTYTYKAVDGRTIPSSALEFMPEIDWEQRRYEIAKDIMAMNMSDLPLVTKTLEEEKSLKEIIETIAVVSVFSAKILINELQKRDVNTMRYALRNQDKIASSFSTEYLQQHLIESLNKFFAINTADEIEETLEFEVINGNEYQILRINDIADEDCMLEFIVIGRQYDVLRLAFNGRIKG